MSKIDNDAQETTTIDEASEKRIRELTEKIQRLEAERQGTYGGRYIILATIPNLKIEVVFKGEPRQVVEKSGFTSFVCDDYVHTVCGKGIDEKDLIDIENEDVIESFYEYPPNKFNITEHISYEKLQDMASRYKNLGIVLWDKINEPKTKAQLRGLKAFREYIQELIGVVKSHEEVRKERYNTEPSNSKDWQHMKKYKKIWGFIKHDKNVDAAIKKIETVLYAEAKQINKKEKIAS